MRKIEVQVDGVWRLDDGGWEPALPRRYVGGVLEYQSVVDGSWKPCADSYQCLSFDELDESNLYRLRPYDDAVCTHEKLVATGHGLQCNTCGKYVLGDTWGELPTAEHRHDWRKLDDGRAECRGCRIIKDYEPPPSQFTWSGQCAMCNGRFEVRCRVGDTYECVCGNCIMMSEVVAVLRKPNVTAVSNVRGEAFAGSSPSIANLMGERDRFKGQRDDACKLASKRGDELGTARTRITELEAECFRLRRRAEDAERKSKVRR